MGGNFSVMDYLIWNEIPTVLGNLVGGLAFTGADAVRHARAHGAEARRWQLSGAGSADDAGLPVRDEVRLVRRRDGADASRSASTPTRAARRSTRTSTASLVPAEPLLGAKGIAVALADGIGSSEVSQVASEFAVRGSARRLLLHLRRLVGQEVGRARAGRDQLLAAFAHPAGPVSLRQGPRLRLHAERAGPQVDHRARLPRRRHAHLPRACRGAGAADRRTTACRCPRARAT